MRDWLSTPRPSFARGPVFETLDDSRASLAYAAASARRAWAVKLGTRFAQGEHKATACALGLRDAR
jgi:hypothetical protein